MHSCVHTAQAFKLLKASEQGLDGEEVKRRIEQYGYNKLPESTRNPFLVTALRHAASALPC